MRRILIWTIALAFIGAVFGLKSPSLDLESLTTGILGGALLGFCIGYLLHKSHTRSQR